ncbi:NAD-dependent epimerase/dehydratase family protein [Lentzea tibetensis]|uniref:NAD-dependent epimerase/dehydratase family protein n=1 Tax=Lentzea tibetensis TaxID=2591470 RepID=A0A563ES79_9PSEU|nr:NmrA family NAD(P)-binding protein [Lentzea tibetensis]TWP49978.1 NAD-dependent epimerase/dehydratase family protein [Lentzea tibetensis]
MTILITGATGQFGGAAVRHLLDRTDELLAVSVRDPRKAQHLADRGVDVRQGDFTRPQTLDFSGVDKLLLVSSEGDNDDRIAQHANAVAAAQQAGVGFIAYTSVTDADTSPLLLAQVHKATEERIRATGIPFSFLRNGMYHENYLGLLAADEVATSAGDGRIASAARDDLALAAAIVPAGDGYENTVHELTGPAAWSFPELAGDRFRSVTDDDLRAAGLPEVIVDIFARAREGVFAQVRPDLEKLLGRTPAPIS